jgi:WbqC-like protein family
MLITDLPYFGTIDFVKSISKQNEIYFDNERFFTKMSFKNRMVIATAQGALHLSIPIIGGRDQKSPIKEIKIAYDSPWHLHHYKAITSSYQRAPYFEYYQEDLKRIYNSNHLFLVDFLLEAHYWIKKQIKGNWTLSATKPIEENEEQQKSTHEFVYGLPKNYHLLPNPIVYQQVFEDRVGFLPNLSILDLLFNCGGKQAKYLLSI